MLISRKFQNELSYKVPVAQGLPFQCASRPEKHGISSTISLEVKYK